jgi:hypothetical protein
VPLDLFGGYRVFRLRGSEYADVFATFGYSGPQPIPYELFVCLSLNLDRARTRAVLDSVDALEIAAGKKEVPEEWTDLICDSPEEAEERKRKQRVQAAKEQALRNR